MESRRVASPGGLGFSEDREMITIIITNIFGHSRARAFFTMSDSTLKQPHVTEGKCKQCELPSDRVSGERRHSCSQAASGRGFSLQVGSLETLQMANTCLLPSLSQWHNALAKGSLRPP